MPDPDFWDFVMEGGWALLFPDDLEESVECFSCKRIIKGNEEVEWVDKKKKAFKCPNCGDVLEIK